MTKGSLEDAMQNKKPNIDESTQFERTHKRQQRKIPCSRVLRNYI